MSMVQIWTWRSWAVFCVVLCAGCGSSLEEDGALAPEGSGVRGDLWANPAPDALVPAPSGNGAASDGAEPESSVGPLPSPGSAEPARDSGAGGAPTSPGDTGDVDRPRLPNGYIDLSPPGGAPFDPNGGAALTPPPPPGWTWHPVEGSRCRDGSEAGLFIRFQDSRRLMIYFEGGGACTSPGFCNFNPQSVNHVLSGTGETVLGSALGAVVGRQQPGVYQNGELSGIFADARADNPFSDWNMVYVPYCTGDVHAGTRDAAVVPGVAASQHFVGHRNTELFVGRLAATFAPGLERVVVGGSSAGSFGAALSFSMIADAFAGAQVDALLDSGVPFDDSHWPPCLQRSWRELLGSTRRCLPTVPSASRTMVGACSASPIS